MITQGCFAAPMYAHVQGSQVAVAKGSQVAVDATGKVYVAWEAFLSPTAVARSVAISSLPITALRSRRRCASPRSPKLGTATVFRAASATTNSPC